MKLNINLNKILSSYLEKIKSYYQLTNNSEVIRLVISQTHKSIANQAFIYEVPQVQKNIISELLKRGDLYENRIYTISDFIKSALDSKIEELKPQNILHRSIRYNMNKEERQIANTFVKIVLENQTKDVQVSEVRKLLNWDRKDDQAIQDILDQFVIRKLINKEIENNRIYYFV